MKNTKKFLIGLLFGVIFSINTGIVNGYSTSRGEYINITAERNDDQYIIGDNINLDSVINGDVNIFGSDIKLGGLITNDSQIFGNRVIIKGEIQDDVRIFANEVIILGNIKGDLIITAESVDIGNEVEIGGDLVVMASNLIMNGKILGGLKINVKKLQLEGTVKGNSTINAQKIILGQNSQIYGNLTYFGENTDKGLEAITQGKKTREVRTESNVIETISRIINHYIVFCIFFLSLVSGVIYFLFENKIKEIANFLANNRGSSLFYGFLTACAVPFTIGILLFSVILSPIGVLLGALYSFWLFSFEIMTVLLGTALISEKYFYAPKTQNILGKVMTIISLSGISAFIIGRDLILGLFSLGAFVLFFTQKK